MSSYTPASKAVLRRPLEPKHYLARDYGADGPACRRHRLEAVLKAALILLTNFGAFGLAFELATVRLPLFGDMAGTSNSLQTLPGTGLTWANIRVIRHRGGDLDVRSTARVGGPRIDHPSSVRELAVLYSLR